LTATAGGVSDSVRVRVAPELALRPLGTLPIVALVTDEVSLAARVEDLLGTAYEGARVLWSVGAGSGAIVSEQETTSDATGAVGSVWRLGQVAGIQRAFAQVETRGRTEVVEFVADAGAGPAVSASLVADSILLSASGETAFLAPSYADEFGNQTSGAGATWSSAEPAVASVSPDGLVTGGIEGSTWVVGTMDGMTADSILVTVIHRGAITITFDDGFRSVYENAWPVLKEFGLAANVAVNPIPVDGGYADYMTREMLDELHGAGWSMVSHTLEHDSLPSLGPAELDYDLRTTQQWIVDAGYNGWNVFVAPYHAYGPAERDAVSKYYEAARGVSSNIVSPDTMVAWRPDNPYLLTGREADFLPYTTQAGRDELRALLQRTLDEGAFLDVFFHRVPPENVDELRAMLEVVDDFRDRVLPYHELFPLWARSVH
jgi:peptidoglycan/xylan/chitin deacetylase (PgdA/CDA1 family)